ncbi:MAG: hypothetical protein NWF14_08075 [Candidatus Bathyarchaeota archaeon]|nr:hypothetical protein [Candidatus Bathyarchaeota archaeon]
MEADDPKLLDWLEKGGNYGIVGGNGIVIADADSKELKTVIARILPHTFTAKSPGSNGYHSIYKVDDDKPIRLWDIKHKNIGDIQGKGKWL